MSEFGEQVCKGCGAAGEKMQLEVCGMCRGWFCPDCAHRAGFGRRYCSAECTRAYYFAGELEDDDDDSDE